MKAKDYWNQPAKQPDGTWLDAQGMSHDSIADLVGTNLRPDYLLGREIKLSPQLRALASADGPARYRFRSRWLVRGHFRQQPVGEGRAERRTTWIQPYWKGPTDGPVLVPRYVAGEDA